MLLVENYFSGPFADTDHKALLLMKTNSENIKKYW